MGLRAPTIHSIQRKYYKALRTESHQSENEYHVHHVEKPMLIIFTTLMFVFLLKDRNNKGPIFYLSVAWLIASIPLIFFVMDFSYLRKDDWYHTYILCFYCMCYIFGYYFYEHKKQPIAGINRISKSEIDKDFFSARHIAKYCWMIAATGTIFLIIDFSFLGGAGLDDLATLRETYSSQSASISRKVASILTWGCLYCFAFSLYYMKRLKSLALFIYLAPIVGFFLVAVFSAGRQTAFQILIFSILSFTTKNYQRVRTPRKEKKGIYIALVISLVMIFYMGYVAGARNDAVVSADKVEVLSRLFDFEIAEWFVPILDTIGGGARTTLVEALVYFSSPTALFARFLDVNLQTHSFGAMTIPFIFRQIEPLTGMSVIGLLNDKMAMMNDAGVIGAGWTTAFSYYILDFGYIGAAFFVFLHGYYSSYTWRRAKIEQTFHTNLVSIILITSALYSPMLAASSDTNLLFLWLFCGIIIRWHKVRKAINA